MVQGNNYELSSMYSWKVMTVYKVRVIGPVSLVGQELLTIPEHLGSPALWD